MSKRKSQQKMKSACSREIVSYSQLNSYLVASRSVYSFSPLITRSLCQKYSQTQINTCEALSIENFISGRSRVYPGGYYEFAKFYDDTFQKHIMRKLYSIKEVKNKITNLIKLRLQTDINYILHYQYPFSYHMLRNMNSHQKVVTRESFKKRFHKEDLKSTEVEDLNQGKKNPNSNNVCAKNILPKDINRRNETIDQLKILTNNIDKMCTKFKKKPNLGKGVNGKFISKKMDYMDSDVYLNFKKSIEDNFSMIKGGIKCQQNVKNNKKSIGIVVKKTKSKETRDIYGLDRCHAQKKNFPLAKSSVGSSSAKYLSNESPIIKAYYLRETHPCEKTEKTEKIVQQRTPSKDFKRKRSVKSLSRSVRKRKGFRSDSSSSNQTTVKNLSNKISIMEACSRKK